MCNTRTIIDAMHAAIERDGLTAQIPYFAGQSLNHGFPTSHDELRAVLQDIQTTFPDFTLDLLDLCVEGDLAIGRYAVSGTHLGTQRIPFVHGGVLAGLAPTGRSFRAEHAHVFRIADGKIASHDSVQDNLEMARQLGVTPGVDLPAETV